MKLYQGRRATAAACAALLALGLVAGAWAQEKIQPPIPGVPEIYTIQGQFVRVAYNNEGYVSLGYRIANLSVGEEWMLLEVGLTLRDGVKDYTLKRDALTLSTPDGKTIALASNEDYRKANLRALEQRADVSRDSINYFPPSATRGCRIGFFAQLESRAMPWDQVDLSSMRGCVGRLFFHVPGGIQHGQHWLNVQFAGSLVRAPFRILTKEEEKEFSKTWQDIKKELDAAFKKALEKK